MTNTPETTITEIADGIHQISTFLPEGPPGGLTFNQFLVVGDEPLLIHTGMRRLFPAVLRAVETIVDPADIRWITSNHVSRPDEYGALDEWLEVAPNASATHGFVGCFVCLSEMSVRPPRPLADGERLDLGAHVVRWIDTPHVPGPWEAGVLFDETTKTMFCGDLFARSGPASVTTTDDITDAAIAHDLLMHGQAYTPAAGAVLRRLAALDPQRLALMHGPTFIGEGAAQLTKLADYFDARLTAA
jgi:flavorubredoxin